MHISFPGSEAYGQLPKSATTVRVRRDAPGWPRWIALALLALLIAGCASSGHFSLRPTAEAFLPPDSTLLYRVFLIGDAGKPSAEHQEPTLKLLQHRIHLAGARSAVVFLGDNIYPSGMPGPYDPGRDEAERRIMEQIKITDGYNGQVVFLPGNHDWGGLGLGGEPGTLRREETFIESALDRGNTFLPDRGTSGPAEVALTDSLTLIVIDTQWWLEPNKVYGTTGQYAVEQEVEFLIALDDAIRRNHDKDVIVVGHHPVFSNGEHGGHFAPQDRLNPVEIVSRKYLGTPQDLSNYNYRRLITGLLSVFEQHDGLIYAAGHEHDLQFFDYKKQHYIVSGAGSKSGYVVGGHGASFVSRQMGFAEVSYFTDGSVWLVFRSPVGDGTHAEQLYRVRLREGSSPLVSFNTLQRRMAPTPPDTAQVDTLTASALAARADSLRAIIQPDTTRVVTPPAAVDTTHGTPNAVDVDSLHVTPYGQQPYAFYSTRHETLRAGPEYAGGPLRKLFLGSQYRDLWNTPVEVPVIDLDRTAGGLVPIRHGGGLQTSTLHLLGADGDEYVLRSVNKNPEKSLPPYLRKTIVDDVARDQLAAIHPYSAFTVTPMAEALGVLHTAPRLVVIPDSPTLGIYRSEFAGVLALFESKPDEDQRDEDRFGNAENVIGSAKLFENLEGDNDEMVDERAFARARMLDMIIGDWDRHKEQWRWSEYDLPDDRKIYEPVPRDRDFAFFKFDGLVASLARRFGSERMRRLTNFAAGYNDVFGLNFNGAKLDRRFTSRLTRDDWIEIADSVRMELTDEALRRSVRQMPDPIYEKNGKATLERLIYRRDHLRDAVARYYDDWLSTIVDVVGSNKHERFEVHRLNDRETEVVMYKTHKEGDVVRELYRRTFDSDETKELRLFGMGGNDQFVVTGSVHDGILLRLVGGPGADVYVDSSRVDGPGHLDRYYDTRQGNEWHLGSEGHAYRSDDPVANLYRMRRFEYDKRKPLVTAGENADDGLLIGGGYRFITEGYAREPYAARHDILASFATARPAVNLFYDGEVIEFYKTWDLLIDAEALADRNLRNFYGLGNETDKNARDVYNARLGRVTVTPALRKQLWFFTDLTVGPRFEYTNVDPPKSGPTAFSPGDFVDRYFVGADARLNVDGTDTLAATQYGLRWTTEIQSNLGFRTKHTFHTRLTSEASYFYTFYGAPKRTTLALRAGGAYTFGSFAFYQANTLGGDRNLRGFQRSRFAGRGSIYGNAEVRIRLFDLNTYLTRGDMGVMAFFDNGRVWADDEHAPRWHYGYGAGLWYTPLNRIVLNATVSRSPENAALFNFRFGFLF